MSTVQWFLENKLSSLYVGFSPNVAYAVSSESCLEASLLLNRF